jgi:hypothetical protein
LKYKNAGGKGTVATLWFVGFDGVTERLDGIRATNYNEIKKTERIKAEKSGFDVDLFSEGGLERGRFLGHVQELGGLFFVSGDCVVQEDRGFPGGQMGRKISD